MRSFAMDHAVAGYWAVIAALVSASVFYGSNVWLTQRAGAVSGAKLETGDIVRLAKILDGDTLVVEKPDHGSAIVRVLGIKAFDSKIERDPTAVFGRAAEDALRRAGQDRPLRVLLHTTARDRLGRTIATLFADEEDLGLQMVSQGLALVYTPYPFAAMPIYLREQAAARKAKIGLWADPEIAARADRLTRGWQREVP